MHNTDRTMPDFSSAFLRGCWKAQIFTVQTLLPHCLPWSQNAECMRVLATDLTSPHLHGFLGIESYGWAKELCNKLSSLILLNSFFFFLIVLTKKEILCFVSEKKKLFFLEAWSFPSSLKAQNFPQNRNDDNWIEYNKFKYKAFPCRFRDDISGMLFCRSCYHHQERLHTVS